MQRSRQDDRAGRDRLTVSSHMRHTDTSSGTSDGTEARANSAAITLLVGDSSEPPVPPLCLCSTPLPSASSASAPPRHLLNLLRSWLRLNSFSSRLCLGSTSPRLHIGPSRPRLLGSSPRFHAACCVKAERPRPCCSNQRRGGRCGHDGSSHACALRAPASQFFRRRHKVGVRLTMACSNLERLEKAIR